jgi:hypothetical protein
MAVRCWAIATPIQLDRAQTAVSKDPDRRTTTGRKAQQNMNEPDQPKSESENDRKFATIAQILREEADISQSILSAPMHVVGSPEPTLRIGESTIFPCGNDSERLMALTFVAQRSTARTSDAPDADRTANLAASHSSSRF